MVEAERRLGDGAQPRGRTGVAEIDLNRADFLSGGGSDRSERNDAFRGRGNLIDERVNVIAVALRIIETLENQSDRTVAGV
jgi:hypothetical protein